MDYYQRIVGNCMDKELSVLLSGYHGVGKTQVVLEAAGRRELRLKYYSSATLDPWSDLCGIPVPAEVPGREGRELQFIRPPDIKEAQVIFFDELNRAHPKVQNAVLEMVQFRSINGERLPNLKMVWAAVNPPDDIYSVTPLDPALEDRFQVHLHVEGKPSVAYYRDRAGIEEGLARALVNWWELDLDEELRKKISPRRLEYMGRCHMYGIELMHTLPAGVTGPLQHLRRRLSGKALPFDLTPEALLGQQEAILQEMDDKDIMLAVARILGANPSLVPNCFRLFLALKEELQASLVNKEAVRKALVNLSRARRGEPAFRPLADRLKTLGVL